MASMQGDYFGAAAMDHQVGSTRPRPPSLAPSGPARKVQKRTPADSASDDQDDANGGPTPSGPPFICPTCSTSYSRLEYLRRHERRHADIRPFVCDCGKGFSRSDVLSRHKRQCRVVLQIDGGGENDAVLEGESPPKSTKGRRSSVAKPGRPKGSTKAAKAAASSSNGNGADSPAPPPPAPEDGDFNHESPNNDGQDQEPQGEQDAAAMIDPAIAADSHASATSGGLSASVTAFANAPGSFPYLPVHSQISALSHQYYPPSSPESNASRSEHGSPRYASQGLVRHGSNPGSRFGLRTSSFDQYGARQLGSGAFSSADAAIWEGLDTAKLPSPGHVTAPSAAARASASVFAGLGPGFPVTSPLSHLSDRTRNSPHLGSDASYFRTGAGGLAGVSLGGGVGLGNYNTSASSPAFSYQTSGSATVISESNSTSTHPASTHTGVSSVSQGHGEGSGAITPKEPVRFSVSTTGPLSPFSNTALNSSMSPYLSAFSNARDTPLVSSPRSGLPSTPGALASLDLGGQWSNMRPPSRPISRHNSIHGLTTTSSNTSPHSDTQSATGKISKSSSSEKLNAHESLARSTMSGSYDTSEKEHTSTGSNDHIKSTSSASSKSETAIVGVRGGDGTGTPSRFVKNQSEQYFDGGALTPGPEAFLLRVQGGAQEMRAGINSMKNVVFGPSSALGSASLTSQNSSLFSDSPVFSGSSSGVGSGSNGFGNQNNALGWLMSPSIQQLLNAFPPGGPASSGFDKNDYFSVGDGVRMDSQTQNSILSLNIEVQPSTLEKTLTDTKNPFFIPPHMFRPCYSISHWNLPPLTRLSVLALHAQQNLLKHFPIIHEPTFRIDTTPGCIAFTICMLGCHEAGRKWWAGEEVVPKSAANVLNCLTQPPRPTNRTEEIEDEGPSKFIDEEDGQELVKPIVLTEKMDMLMRSFASRCKSVKDRCAVVQSLMLYQSNSFLSSNPATRTIAAISHDSVVALARQSGFFDVAAEHAKREVTYTPDEVSDQVAFEAADLCFSFSFLPSYLPGYPDEEKIWRRWSDLEGRRRTSFVFYVIDTVASLDAGIPTLLKVEEVAHLPLPSPDQLWRAANAHHWRSSLESYQGPTLDTALHELLSVDSKIPGSRGESMGCSIYGLHGPFARLAMIISLLRGIIDMLEGRVQQVAKPSPLQSWLGNSVQKGKWSAVSHVTVYKRALSRWRKAWDLDETCKVASGPNVFGNGQPNESLFTPLTASGATPLCDDALPLYWLSHVLVTHAASDQKLPLRHSSGGSSEMPDFRSMLRFAKNFVTKGEQ